MKNIIVIAPMRTGHNFIMAQLKAWDSDNEFFIGNVESTHPCDYEKRKERPINNHGIVYKWEKPYVNVVITRDLLNWLASYLKWMEHRNNMSNKWSRPPFMIELWRNVTAEVFGGTNYIKDKHPVIYDEFRDNVEVRKDLAAFVGGIFTDKKLDEVPVAGEGSSFDKLTRKGTELQTSLRWMQILETPLADRYINLLKQSPEAVSLYRHRFELTGDQAEFLMSI